jgi:hypothetical protein
MTRAVFDTTLADLAHIKVTAITTLIDAERDNPAKVNVEIESAVLSSILTSARLHFYDHPYRPKAIDPNSSMVEIAKQNEEESRDWHWMMEDTIEVLSGRLAVAVIPERHYDLKDESVASRRKMRPVVMKMDAEDKAKHLAKADDTPEGLRSWVASTNTEALDDLEVDNLIRGLRKDPTKEISPEVVMGLLAAYIEQKAAADSAKTAMSAARRVLGGS